jgi:hypothetical protein
MQRTGKTDGWLANAEDKIRLVACGCGAGLSDGGTGRGPWRWGAMSIPSILYVFSARLVSLVESRRRDHSNS